MLSRSQLNLSYYYFESQFLAGLDKDDFYPFGTMAGDSRLPRNDDGFQSVDISVVFPFFDEAERSLFVSEPVSWLHMYTLCVC